MFLPFFYQLRTLGVPVSSSELMDFLTLLKNRLQRPPLLTSQDFFHLARTTLVKDLKHFDLYQNAFTKTFGGLLDLPDDFHQKLQEYLAKTLEQNLSDKKKSKAPLIPPEELLKELEKRLKDQDGEHHGGNHWVGTKGTSPFGHSGFNLQGMRLGGASGAGNRSALAMPTVGLYQDYRTDIVLNVRQLKLALKKLRLLKKSGLPQLSLTQTIKKTCDQGGEIELVFEASRKNKLKLLLLMDVGGSMSPYAKEVSALFSAAHQMQHFKEFKSYYFHNIFYDQVYINAHLRKGVDLSFLYNRYPRDTRTIIVGDACMAPYELSSSGNLYNFFNPALNNKKNAHALSAYQHLQQWKKHFPYSVWLNPEKEQFWSHPTIQAIGEVVPMFFLSLDGINRALKNLLN